MWGGLWRNLLATVITEVKLQKACFVIFRHILINPTICLSVSVSYIRIKLGHCNALYFYFDLATSVSQEKNFIIFFFSLSVLQIALFYVAVLAGLLHRFPVSFSQVRIFVLLIYLFIWAQFEDGLQIYRVLQGSLGAESLGILGVLKFLNKGKLLHLLMLLVLMRQRRSWKRLWYVRPYLKFLSYLCKLY